MFKNHFFYCFFLGTISQIIKNKHFTTDHHAGIQVFLTTISGPQATRLWQIKTGFSGLISSPLPGWSFKRKILI